MPTAVISSAMRTCWSPSQSPRHSRRTHTPKHTSGGSHLKQEVLSQCLDPPHSPSDSQRSEHSTGVATWNGVEVGIRGDGLVGVAQPQQPGLGRESPGTQISSGAQTGFSIQSRHATPLHPARIVGQGAHCVAQYDAMPSVGTQVGRGVAVLAAADEYARRLRTTTVKTPRRTSRMRIPCPRSNGHTTRSLKEGERAARPRAPSPDYS